MDLLTGNIKKIYWKYLISAFGSAFITSIYGVVDMAMVGHFHGPSGAAALAIVAPVWNVIYSIGLLTGIGGSVIFATLRGESKDNVRKSNEYFSVAVIVSVILAVIIWIAMWLFEDEIMIFFGADSKLLTLTKEYLMPIRFIIPLFLLNQMLTGFLRNDNDPVRATAAILSGGVFNIFGDYFFVYTLGWGIFGAGFATALGAGLGIAVGSTHFLSKKNTLRLVRPTGIIIKTKEICVTGFSTFFIDVAMGILTLLFNRQIQAYLGTNALAVYGVIVNVSTFVQCCAYSVGQAAQPLMSRNYGAGNSGRIKETLHYALYTIAAFTAFWMIVVMAFPTFFTQVFMDTSKEIIRIAPGIVRTYSISFLLLPLNVFSTYYFQAIMKPRASFIVSIARGCVISGTLILLLPATFGAGAIWLAMPITELITAIYVIRRIKSYTLALN